MFPVFELLLALWLVIIFLPFAMRTWRAFLALCAVYLLIGVGVRLGVATLSAAEVPAALVFLGDFWLDFVVENLPIPVIARAVVLAAKSLGLRGKRLLVLNVIGVLALPGTWYGMVQYDKWKLRPAPAECTARPISLTLGSVDGTVPWNEAISLHVGPDLPEDARYLFLPASQRRICSETANGTARLKIAALSIELRKTARCTAVDVQRWEQDLCREDAHRDLRTLPHDLVFFDPNGIQPGYFAIPQAVTDGSYPVPTDENLVSTRTADGETITASCRKKPYSGGRVLCVVRSKVANGIDVSWEIYAPPGDIADRLRAAGTFAGEVCSSIFDFPGCRGIDEAAP